MNDEATDEPINAEPDTKPDETLKVNYRVRTEGFANDSLGKTETVNLRAGVTGYLKQATLFYGKDDDGNIKDVPSSIKLGTYARKYSGGYRFERPVQQWNGYGNDIQLLATILKDKLPQAGTYQLLSGDEEANRLAKRILDGDVPVESASQIIDALINNPEAEEMLSKNPASKILADQINLFRQRKLVDKLEEVVLNPLSSEQDIQNVLENDWWVFGGKFIEKSKRRSLVIMNELDIPLIRHDGSLHIIELKKANISNLITSHRSHNVVGTDISKSAGQVMNYLVGLDEDRGNIYANLKIDVRRASATIVVGHPVFMPEVDDEHIRETIRVYNSHLTRIQVITYEDLIAGIRNSLTLNEEE